ncbi:acetyltransferase [Colletotrichum lupini]|uniref:Glucosamine 6-phosphate N-acetyltransferase n=9 Tax=Colletotrichum acutatum species complex TaxID=2707335 RepID=A0A9Q8T4Y3_9PEZI|nr:acetyltransferase [Colletotrichum lupini]UQC89296.1 acetyltransferase [Colletotrichum lupini]
MAEAGLFTDDLVSPTVAAALPEGYIVRALRQSDYNTGFLDCLRVLTTVGEIGEAQFAERYQWLSKSDGYYILVIEDTNTKTVVGTGALIVERKFIHNLGLVGHIEDIAVAKDQQGKKLGLRIIQALDFIAAKVGCYKSILDCSEANEGFYVKCGFRRAGLEMAHYYEGDKSKAQPPDRSGPGVGSMLETPDARSDERQARFRRDKKNDVMKNRNPSTTCILLP